MILFFFINNQSYFWGSDNVRKIKVIYKLVYIKLKVKQGDFRDIVDC